MEKQYDEIIAPMLKEVALKCEELGMAMVSRVEWKPGEAGITQIGDNNWSASQKLAHRACLARGNVDSLCMSLLKEPGADSSMFLRNFLKDG